MGKNKPFTRRWKLKNNSVVLNRSTEQREHNRSKSTSMRNKKSQ